MGYFIMLAPVRKNEPETKYPILEKFNWYITGFFFNKLVFREIMKFLSLNEIKSSLYIRIVRDGYSCAATVKSITCTGSLFPWGLLYDAF